MAEAENASGMVARDLSSRVDAAARDRDVHRRLTSTRALVQRDKAVHRLQVRERRIAEPDVIAGCSPVAVVLSRVVSGSLNDHGVALLCSLRDLVV